MPMSYLLGANHCLPLSHMAKSFIWINETIKNINEFTVGYMINLSLNVKNAFREQAETVYLLHLVKSHILLLNPHYQKIIPLCKH